MAGKAKPSKKINDQLKAHQNKDASENYAPISKLYFIPRNAQRCLEVEVQEGRKEIVTKTVGPNFGKEGCKFLRCDPSVITQNEFYCVPYDGSRVLLIDTAKESVDVVGNELQSERVTKYTAAAASLNWQGNLYAAPCMADRVLEIDPQTGVVREVGPRIGNPDNPVAKWWAIGASPTTLKLYAIPWNARRVLEIDPKAGGAAKEIGPDLGKVQGKYMCVQLTANGKLYAPPFNAEQVLEIDEAGHVSLVGPNFGGPDKAPRKYTCVIEAKNRLLYAPPLYADRVLEINCAKGESRHIGPVLGFSEAKYACAALGPDDNIYCAPLEARRVLMITPADHEVEEIGIDLGREVEKYSCIAKAPVGTKLYAAPRSARNILEICTRRYMVKEVGRDMGGDKRKFSYILPGKVTIPQKPGEAAAQAPASAGSAAAPAEPTPAKGT